MAQGVPGSGTLKIGILNDMSGVYSDDQGPGSVLAGYRLESCQAVELAIDKHAITDGLLAGRAKVAGSVLAAGPYALELVPSGYNPDQAQAMLEEAGWTVGPDGIRSKGGTRAHLKFIAGVGR